MTRPVCTRTVITSLSVCNHVIQCLCGQPICPDARAPMHVYCHVLPRVRTCKTRCRLGSRRRNAGGRTISTFGPSTPTGPVSLPLAVGALCFACWRTLLCLSLHNTCVLASAALRASTRLPWRGEQKRLRSSGLLLQSSFLQSSFLLGAPCPPCPPTPACLCPPCSCTCACLCLAKSPASPLLSTAYTRVHTHMHT